MQRNSKLSAMSFLKLVCLGVSFGVLIHPGDFATPRILIPTQAKSCLESVSSYPYGSFFPVFVKHKGNSFLRGLKMPLLPQGSHAKQSALVNQFPTGILRKDVITQKKNIKRVQFKKNLDVEFADPLDKDMKNRDKYGNPLDFQGNSIAIGTKKTCGYAYRDMNKCPYERIKEYARSRYAYVGYLDNLKERFDLAKKRTKSLQRHVESSGAFMTSQDRAILKSVACKIDRATPVNNQPSDTDRQLFPRGYDFEKAENLSFLVYALAKKIFTALKYVTGYDLDNDSKLPALAGLYKSADGCYVADKNGKHRFYDPSFVESIQYEVSKLEKDLDTVAVRVYASK